MTEEVKTVEPVVDAGTAIPGETHISLNPTEAQAKAQGWMTKEEWVEAGNDPEDHRPAREFKERGDFFKRISDQNRKIDQLSSALNALQTHHKVVYDKAYTRALADLKGQHRAAVEAGDVNRADQIIDRMEATKQEAAQAAQATTVQAPGVSADYEDFVTNNGWYADNRVMKAYADSVGNDYAFETKRNTGQWPTPAQVVKAVEKAVREEFPDKFGVKKSAPSQSAVAGAGSPARPAPTVNGKSEKDLPPEAKEVMQSLVRSKTMTKEQYLKEYFSR